MDISVRFWLVAQSQKMFEVFVMAEGIVGTEDECPGFTNNDLAEEVPAVSLLHLHMASQLVTAQLPLLPLLG